MSPVKDLAGCQFLAFAALNLEEFEGSEKSRIQEINRQGVRI